MKIVVFVPNKQRQASWTEHLASLLPQHDVTHYDDTASTNPNEIDIAVVWRPPTGWLASLPNLRLTVSIGAGIDHVVQDESYPPHVPILKTVGPDMVQRMSEYVLLQVLRLHRRLPELQKHQAAHRWDQLLTPVASQRCVGIMGLGRMGTAAARVLSNIGFQVSAWSASRHDIEHVSCFAGEQELPHFLQQTDILVCLLPLTPKTHNILNATLFQQLPPGASIINAARGQHLVESDLLHALESGHLSQATLDVFVEEPLPTQHPFWSHPNILVTPHVASLIDPLSGGQIIADNIEAFLQDRPLTDLTRAQRCY